MSNRNTNPSPFVSLPGDHRARREHLANLLLANLPKVTRVAQRKLTARTRGVHDGSDIASSVLRRMDRLAAEGRLAGLSDEDIIGFALVVASNQAVSRSRAMERFARFAREDAEYAQLMHARLAACVDDEQAELVLYRIALGIPDASARQLFMLRWRGLSSDLIGQLLGISAEAVRQRWSALRGKLAERLARGEFDERL